MPAKNPLSQILKDVERYIEKDVYQTFGVTVG